MLLCCLLGVGYMSLLADATVKNISVLQAVSKLCEGLRNTSSAKKFQ